MGKAKAAETGARFAKWLRGQRIAHDMSHADVGRSLKVTRAFVNQIELGRKPAPETFVRRASRLFGAQDEIEKLLLWSGHTTPALEFLMERFPEKLLGLAERTHDAAAKIARKKRRP